MDEEIREEVITEERPSEENRLQDDGNDELNRKLRQYFDGKIVRKDLTKHIKEGRMFRYMYWYTFLVSTAILRMSRSSARAWIM